MKKQKPVGRPPLAAGETTLRVGFTVNGKLWQKFLETVEYDQTSQSELFRRILEQYFDRIEKQNPR